MAAGQVMSHLNPNPNPTASKRYSFLDDLDNLHLAQPELSFTASASSRRVDDESVRRLSTSLQNLLSQKHGSNQLPELPIPTYDNGNVDLDTMQPRVGPGPRPSSDVHHDTPRPSTQSRPRLSIPTIAGSRIVPRMKDPSLQAQPVQRTSDHLLDAERSANRRSYTQLSHIEDHTDSPRISCYSSVSRGHKPSQVASSQKSRPSSSYGTTTNRRVKSCSRPSTARSQVPPPRQHKKSTSCTESKYVPPNPPDSPKSQFRRRFRLMPSLKDLHAQAKDKARRMTSESKPLPQDHVEPVAPQLISLHDALRGGTMPLTPLHDPDHDQQFTQECEEMLKLRPAPRQKSIRRRLIPRHASVPQDYEATPKIKSSMFGHRSTASDAPTVSSSILDVEWPQPNTYTAVNPEVYQRLRSTANTTRCMPTVQNQEARQVSAPSPPPTYPLPPVPVHNHASLRRHAHNYSVSSTKTYIATDGAPYKSNSALTDDAVSRRSNRITALAASKGLHVDARAYEDGSSKSESLATPTVDPLPSPLHTRLNQSKRNSRVSELKRRHLSMLVRDTPEPIPSNVGSPKIIRPGSYPAEIPTSIYSPRRTSAPRRLVSTDNRNQIPMVPGSARYHNTSQDPTGVIKANIGKSRNMRQKPTSFRCSGRQLTAGVKDRPLAHSGVMVMVDSSPRQCRDFRAGAIRVTTPPRRRTSLNKTQMLTPTRYQSGGRRRTPSGTSASRRDSRQIRDSGIFGQSQPPSCARQMSSDNTVELAISRRASGLVSPSKASSILEPAPIMIPQRRRDVGQYQVSVEKPHTPTRCKKPMQYKSCQDNVSEPQSPGDDFGCGRTSPNSRQSQLEQLHAEIDRMVRSRRDLKPRNEGRSQTELTFADRAETEMMGITGLRPLSKKPSHSMVSHDMMSQVEAATWLAKTMSPSDRPVDVHDDSDLSITPKSSFQSSSSESSKFQRKNSDASLTDPNEFDGVNPYLPKSSSGRIYIIPSPTPPEEELSDSTPLKPRKKYTNILTRMSTSKTMDNLNSRLNYNYTTAHHLTTTPQPYRIPHIEIPEDEELDFSSSTISNSDDDIELNHFLTEADQMDNAIDSFIQSTWCLDREMEPVPGIPKRSMLSTDNRKSAVSNIVDLQRIQDQVNGKQDFGRISLITRPRTT